MTDEDYKDIVETVLNIFQANGLSRLQAATVATCAINSILEEGGVVFTLTAHPPVFFESCERK